NLDPSTGQLSFKTPPDFENPTGVNHNNSYGALVQVDDGNGHIVQQAVNVSVNNVNEGPVFTSAVEFNVLENTQAVTTVHADSDNGGNITYGIVANEGDWDKFSINNDTGALSFIAPPDFENPTDVGPIGAGGKNNAYNVTITATDEFGLHRQQEILVRVQDDSADNNHNPTITSAASASVAENIPTSTVVSKVAATDPDLGQTLTFGLVAAVADSNLFNIDPTTGNLTFKVAPDFENPTDAGQNNVYNSTVQVTDGHGGSITQALTVTVTDVN